MSEGVSDFEREILLKVLEGAHTQLSVLREQIQCMPVESRKRERNRYLVKFSVPSRNKNFKLKAKSHSNSLVIRDAVLCIEESNNRLYVELTVINGWLRYLDIGGDYNFEKNFTIKSIGWLADWLTAGESNVEKLVYDADDRNFETAIGYIPDYK